MEDKINASRQELDKLEDKINASRQELDKLERERDRLVAERDAQ